MTGRFYRLCAVFPPPVALLLADAGYDVTYIPALGVLL